MKTVLLLNHQYIRCGVYQFGKRIFNLASESKKVRYVYKDVGSHDEYTNALASVKPDFIVYNWHWDRMPWLTNDDILCNSNSKHYFIYHDGSMMDVYDKYLIYGAMPPSNVNFPDGKVKLLPRPLYRFDGDLPVNDVIAIGSFGFAFNHKNFHTIAPFVGASFPKSIVNLHFTNPYFGDTPGNKLADIIDLCHRHCPSNVTLRVTTDFMDDAGVLKFMAGNDLNLFMYDISLQNPGISSAIDYALSVRRPISVSNNMMFRHIMCDDIMFEKRSLSQIIDNGVNPLLKYYSDWSPENFCLSMEELFI